MTIDDGVPEDFAQCPRCGMVEDLASASLERWQEVIENNLLDIVCPECVTEADLDDPMLPVRKRMSADSMLLDGFITDEQYAELTGESLLPVDTGPFDAEIALYLAPFQAKNGDVYDSLLEAMARGVVG